MKNLVITAAVLTVSLIAASDSGFAQQRRVDVGKLEYESNCASCHGTSGKGDGVIKPYLSKNPSDITTLAKKNGGVFPINRVYEVIDGRQDVKPHGTRDMPVWGRDYVAKATDDLVDSEMYVRHKILALIDYIYRLQVK